MSEYECSRCRKTYHVSELNSVGDLEIVCDNCLNVEPDFDEEKLVGK